MKKCCSDTMRSWAAMLLTVLGLVLLPFVADAKGSFGGSRGGGGGRSFGGSSRSFGSGRSFGGSRPSTNYNRSTPPPSSYNRPSTSFGGSRQSFGSSQQFRSGADYQKRYGIPRRTDQMSLRNNSGINQNYRFNSYGGFGDGFMTGYLMGSIPWYWHTPFHPAFYYSRPVVINGSDGVSEVYPGSFSFGSLILGFLIIGGIIFIIYAVIRSRRRRAASDYSASSFG